MDEAVSDDTSDYTSFSSHFTSTPQDILNSHGGVIFQAGHPLKVKFLLVGM